MLVVAAFLSIGAIAVVFLLRFLFALGMEAKQQGGRTRQPYRLPRAYLHVSAAMGNPAHGLTLASINPRVASAQTRALNPKLADCKQQKPAMISQRRPGGDRLGTF